MTEPRNPYGYAPAAGDTRVQVPEPRRHSWPPPSFGTRRPGAGPPSADASVSDPSVGPPRSRPGYQPDVAVYVEDWTELPTPCSRGECDCLSHVDGDTELELAELAELDDAELAFVVVALLVVDVAEEELRHG